MQCHADIHRHGTGPPKMPELLNKKTRAIRGIPEELWKLVKMRAALESRTMGEYVSTALANYLKPNPTEESVKNE